MALKELKAYWETLLIDPLAFRKRAWLPCVNPADRQFFVACWESLRSTAGNPSSIHEGIGGWPELLDELETRPALCALATPRQIQSARLHLECLKLTGRPFTAKTRRAELEGLAVRFERPVATVLDLECELCHTPGTGSPPGPCWSVTGAVSCGRLRPSSHRVTIPALFGLLPAPGSGGQRPSAPGRVASLALEWVPREEKCEPKGSGNLYHVPALELVDQDEAFVTALGMALASLESYGLRLADADVRYRLAFRGLAQNEVLSRLSGPSLCRAFELGLLKLFSLVRPGLVKRLPKPLAAVAEMPLGGVAASAAFPTKKDPEGAEPSPRLWGGVGGLLPKLIAAARTTFPAIHTVLVAEDQSVDEAALDRDRGEGFGQVQVLRAGNLEDALSEFGKRTQLNWALLTAGLPEPAKVNVVRNKLLKSLDDLLASTHGGFVEITGEMGRGKSTALSQLVHEGLNSAFVSAHFFLGRAGADSVRPDGIARSLYLQLLASHACQEKREWEGWSVREKLAELLKEIGGHLKEREHKEIILIDAADQFESDGQTFLVGSVDSPNCILRLLPPRMFCVITTRPREHAWRAPGVPMHELDFKDLVDEHEDQLELLRGRNQRLPEPLRLREDFLKEILNAKPLPTTMFTLDGRFRALEREIPGEEQLRRRLHDEVGLWRIAPVALVKAELESTVAYAQRSGISARRALFILGIHVCAGRPITRLELESLDKAAGAKLDDGERLWAEDSKVVLSRAANFFEGDPVNDPEEPFRFCHDEYKRAIEDIEVEVEAKSSGGRA